LQVSVITMRILLFKYWLPKEKSSLIQDVKRKIKKTIFIKQIVAIPLII